MKVGVKTFNNENFLDHFRNKCDFFEVQAIVGNDYSFLKKFKKPFIVHAEHRGFGVNDADSSLHARNLNSFNFARKIADNVKAKHIILHPGIIKNKNCSKEVAVKFFKKIKDKRIIFENLPDFKEGLCTTPEKMKEFMDLTGKGFILDFNHAISAALQGGLDEFKIIREFIKLKPKHYHLGGQKIWKFLGFKKDAGHLALIEGNIDLKRIVKMIPPKATLTLETTTDIIKTDNDLSIMGGLGWKQGKM